MREVIWIRRLALIGAILCFGVVVLGEWRELAPAGLAVNQHALADVDSTKSPAQGNGVHMKFARFGSDHETSRDSVSCS